MGYNPKIPDRVSRGGRKGQHVRGRGKGRHAHPTARGGGGGSRGKGCKILAIYVIAAAGLIITLVSMHIGGVI